MPCRAVKLKTKVKRDANNGRSGKMKILSIKSEWTEEKTIDIQGKTWTKTGREGKEKKENAKEGRERKKGPHIQNTIVVYQVGKI